MSRKSRLWGIQDIERALDRLGKVAEPQPLTVAALAGGQVIADEAKRLVPVLSGNLRDSIVVSASSTLNFSRVAVSSNVVTVYVGPRQGAGSPDGFYGHMVEWGTIDTAAHPFMTPAYENKKAEALQVMAGAVRSDIVRAARG